jgi:hypothetical protein
VGNSKFEIGLVIFLSPAFLTAPDLPLCRPPQTLNLGAVRKAG